MHLSVLFKWVRSPVWPDGWMDSLLNIWPFTTVKIWPLAQKSCKVCLIFCQKLKNCQRSLKLCQSGKISSNLVTLSIAHAPFPKSHFLFRGWRPRSLVERTHMCEHFISSGFNLDNNKKDVCMSFVKMRMPSETYYSRLFARKKSTFYTWMWSLSYSSNRCNYVGAWGAVA